MTDEKELQDSQEPDEQEDETSEEVDTNEESTDESEEEESSEDKDDLKEKNKQLFQRAKKAEEELKKLKSKPAPKKPDTTSTVTLDEVVLLKEYDIDDLETLKTIQAGNKKQGKEMSLLEAKESKLFQAYIKDKEASVKQSKAQLSASTKSVNINKSGKKLTREEHMKVFNEMVK